MISWMQKNNKFLIVTIWIATISFIFTGATYGFKYGIKSSSIGETGDIELSRDRFQMEYRNIYNRYNQMFQGKFDEKQAEAMGLQQQVLNSMAGEALLLNLANEFGIIVSDKELAEKLASIPIFQKDGIFNKNIYNSFLRNSGLSIKTFEDSLRDNMIIEKTLSLLNLNGVEEEYNNFATAFEIADKLKYVTLSLKDIDITIDEAKLKSFWESRKEQFQTVKKYSFDIVWVETKDINVTDREIADYFKENSFKYTDTKGKLLSLDEAKPRVINDIKIKKSKKDANRRYISFKKGKIKKDENLTYDVNDFRFPKDVWDKIKSKNIGDLLKPKVVGSRYAIIKITDIEEPTIKTFEEAKDDVIPIFKSDMAREKLAQLAEDSLKNFEKIKSKISDFITLKNIEKQKMGLKRQEATEFISKLFTSEQEKGIISIGDKVVVYKIIEQKLIKLDKNDTKGLKLNVDQIKKESFQSNLMQELDKKYPTKFYK